MLRRRASQLSDSYTLPLVQRAAIEECKRKPTRPGHAEIAKLFSKRLSVVCGAHFQLNGMTYWLAGPTSRRVLLSLIDSSLSTHLANFSEISQHNCRVVVACVATASMHTRNRLTYTHSTQADPKHICFTTTIILFGRFASHLEKRPTLTNIRARTMDARTGDSITKWITADEIDGDCRRYRY